MPLVSISNAQREPVPNANFVATVHHGLPIDSASAARRSARRLSRVPRAHLAGKAARPRHRRSRDALGIPLKIAAKVDRADEAYFREQIEPLLRAARRRVHRRDQRARESAVSRRRPALLFPIDWPEPFGLAMIEAMACGTPVLAFRCGSVPEIVDDGVTGRSSTRRRRQ